MAAHIYENVEAEHIYDEIVNDVRKYGKGNPADSKAKAKNQLDQMDHVTLNIAVTGESGAGKSTFVNALMGLSDGDEGAAETGVTETTMKPIRYSHPTMPGVFIWDLPGIGTSNFKAKTYLKELKFDTFDFFIIIGSVRFKENDIVLAKEIKKIKKLFYFVRSKIDNDVQAEARKKNFNEDEVLLKIRRNCKESLVGYGDAKVFLISALDMEKYDFPKLLSSLKENLSDYKWSALIRSLPATSPGMIDKKTEDLKKTSIAVAAAAATTAGIPIPGFSVGCEIGIMFNYLQTAHASFGLDDKSLRRMADRVNKSHDDLKSAMRSRFAGGVSMGVVSDMVTTKGMKSAKMVEILLFGLPAMAMGVAFATTLHLLRMGIREMALDAKAVLDAAGLSR